MAILLDVKNAYEKLNEFVKKNSFVKFHCASMTEEDGEKIFETMEEKRKHSKEAIRLFQEIGKQICADNGVEWGINPNLAEEADISEEVEKKLNILLDFMRNH